MKKKLISKLSGITRDQKLNGIEEEFEDYSDEDIRRAHKEVCRGRFSGWTSSNTIVNRAGLMFLVVMVLINNSISIEHIDHLNPGECIRDNTFPYFAS